MAICKTKAIVFRRRDFRETSLIVDFYTVDFGKVSGVLKGIRKDPRKFASTVDVFSLNEIVYYRYRNSSLHLVSQCDTVDGFDALRGNMVKGAVAQSMMELVNSLAQEDDKNEAMFSLVTVCLKSLIESHDPEKVLAIFKIKLLAVSGFKPHLDSCVSCGNGISAQVKFSMRMGGLLCGRCMYKDTTARPIFRGTVATILYIANNAFPSTLTVGLNPQIRRELMAVLATFINYHIGGALKSERVVRSLAAVGAGRGEP